MKTTFSNESQTSPAPGIIPEPALVHDELAASTHQASRRAASATSRPGARRTPLARVLAGVRGDKYMVDAYPSAESPPKES